MKRVISLGLALWASLMCATVANAAVITVYTDRTAWENALGGAVITTDTFSNPIASADVIAFDSGIVSTAIPNGFGLNGVSGGRFNGYVCSVGGGCGPTPDEFNWAMPTAVNAIAGDFTAVNSGGGLAFDIDSLGHDGTAIYDEIGGSDGFYGIISDMAFNSVQLRCAGLCGDSFLIDDLSFASAAPAPAPGSLLLIALGLAGLGACRRKTA